MMAPTNFAAVSGRGRRWGLEQRTRVLLCASGVSFMIMLDSNIVAVSLPAIARDLGATFSAIEWVISAYVLTFAALLMSAGALADRFGRRRMLILGLLLFTAASFLCGVAPTTMILDFARALQGVGAAFQLSAALAVLGHAFRGHERARAFGFWGTVIGVAVAVGPPVGGLITSAFGWRWAFLLNVPVGGVLLALALEAVEESSDANAVRLDLSGMASFGAGLFFLVWALIGTNTVGWASGVTLFRFAGAAALIAAFVTTEAVQKRPMVDLALFRRPTFLGSAVAMLGFASGAQVMLTFLPLDLQNVYGFSAAGAGVAMLPFALPLFFMPRVAAYLASRISGRALLTIGLGIVAAGDAVTALIVEGGSPYPLMALGMAVTGCGAGLLNGETAKVSMSVVPTERGGMASGISGTLRFVGLVVGITGLGTVLSAETDRRFSAGTSAAGGGWVDVHASVARIVAGDLRGALPALDERLRDILTAAARASFAGGFAEVLWIAGGVAGLCAVMTYALVSAAETSPSSHPSPSADLVPKATE